MNLISAYNLNREAITEVYFDNATQYLVRCNFGDNTEETIISIAHNDEHMKPWLSKYQYSQDIEDFEDWTKLGVEGCPDFND